jgi:hypothetical protein
MDIYEGILVKQKNDKFMVVILKLNHYPEPCCDTVAEKETSDENEANIWLDDELSKLVTGKGVWDV